MFSTVIRPSYKRVTHYLQRRENNVRHRACEKVVPALLLVVIVGQPLSGFAQELEQVYRFEIPAQALDKSLSELSETTETLFLFPYDLVVEKKGNDVTGFYSMQKALDVLLLGTGLTGEFTSQNAFLIKPSSDALDINSTHKEEQNTMKTQKGILASIIAALFSGNSVAQQAPDASNATNDVEVIQVRGMLSSLKRSMLDKKQSNLVSDGIAAEDLGKFPDLNVAESLQRITGVSIDRSGGEGQSVTVRGFGPQFNTVLINGRQIATDSAGREFNFDVLSADLITGADVYKTSTSTLVEGGIGGTINISTARPFDYEGFQLAGSLKGVYETLSEKTSPAGSILISNTFNEDKLGVLLSVSHAQRDVQINRIETAGWRPNQTISNNVDGVLYSNAYIPRNWDQNIDEQERTRTNASLVIQYAPSDELTLTLDGYVSKFEVDSTVTSLGSWFEPDRVSGDTAVFDEETRTLLAFSQEQGLGASNPATDFISHTRNGRDVSNYGLGLEIEWTINESLTAKFDASTSSAENDIAGSDRFGTPGIVNNYYFDGRGSVPVVTHDGFENGQVLPQELVSYHYAERGRIFASEDEITEVKADFVYTPESDVFQQAEFGVYAQSREKSSFRKFAGTCNAPYCSYVTPVPGDEIDLEVFTAKNFFAGLTDTFYRYDLVKYHDLLRSVGQPIDPVLQNNRYTIKEDITSLYTNFTFGYDLADMPITVNIGARYSTTDVESNGVQGDIADIVATDDLTLFANVFEDPIDITRKSTYANLLPSVNVKLELNEDMIFRFAAYESLTRPTLSQLAPATVFGDPRAGNLTASGGNPALKPFTSENWDISYEWYYGDASLFTFAFFNKEVDDFIITLSGAETFTLGNRVGPDFNCGGSQCDDPSLADPNVIRAQAQAELNGATEVYTVTRPQNGQAANVTGFEVALTHVFDNGFGFTANATVVDSDVSIGNDARETFALEGLGDSQNLILFYEKDRWQARIAFNNREGFLRYIDNASASAEPTGEPVNTDTFGQWDVSASYDINENLSVFFEGINITEEELVQTGRFANQIFNIEDNGSRYALGIRGKF